MKELISAYWPILENNYPQDLDEMLREKYGYDSDQMYRFQLGDYMELNLVNGAVIKGQLTMMVNDNELSLIEINDKEEYALKQIKGNPFIYQSLENFLVIEKQGYVDK